MSKRIKTVLVTVAAAVLFVFLGCAMFQNVVTPAYIDKEAAAYADVNDTSEFLPWSTLWDLEKLEARMDYVHQCTQIVLDRRIEDDTMKYNYLSAATDKHKASAAQLKSALFSPDGLVGAIIPLLSGGVLGSLLIPRPGDTRKKNDVTS